MGTTSYKCNVGTSFRQGATKRATDPTGTNNCNAHRSNPYPRGRLMPNRRPLNGAEA
jgi:hypothetical protein